MNKMPKILLIDDDSDFVEATKMVLESNHFIVSVADNGEKGLRKAKEESPDLVLLDIIMPVKDGFSAAEQFKRDPELKHIPVIMLTSFSTKGQGTGIPFSGGLNLEADDYIEKPVTPEELVKRVQDCLSKANT